MSGPLPIHVRHGLIATVDGDRPQRGSVHACRVSASQSMCRRRRRRPHRSAERGRLQAAAGGPELYRQATCLPCAAGGRALSRAERDSGAAVKPEQIRLPALSAIARQLFAARSAANAVRSRSERAVG